MINELKSKRIDPMAPAAKIKELGLGPSSCVVLNAGGIETVGQLYARSDAELLKIRNVGTRILAEIRQKI